MRRESAVGQKMTDEDFLNGVDEVAEDDTFKGFPEESIEPLRGLLFLGKLSKNVMYAGHDFLIETLTEGQLIRVGQLISEYRGTFSEVEARKAFTVAACCKAVDGYAVATAYASGADEIYDRSKVVLDWYPPVIDFLYSKFRELEVTEFSIANALKKS